MEIRFSAADIPRIQSDLVDLGEIYPLVNGVRSAQRPTRQMQEQGGVILEYALNQPDCAVFQIVVQPMGPAECQIHYSVHGAKPAVALNRFGIGFEGVANLRQYLCQGYHSWDGSFYVDPEALAGWPEGAIRPETSHAMTQLLPQRGSGSLILGFDRHDRFQQTFTFDTRTLPVGLAVETWWDEKEPDPLCRCTSERLLIMEHPGVEDALRHWARRVAQAAPLPPRRAPAISGWCTWYNLYSYISEENVLEHLAGVQAVAASAALPLQVFQIDDGFTPEMGDWLEVKPQFPRGMPPLLAEIRRAGFTPGLWIAPFLVGNRSHLFRDHPDWVVRERQSGLPLAHMKLYAEFRWGKRSEEYYILDTTHPDAFEYLRQVFHTWRHEWGCEYFKTDFMYFGCAYGPQHARWHTPGLTRVEIWRRAAEMIRQEIGEALWTGCGSPLWAAVGLVDGMRIGRDVGVEWRGNHSAQSLLRDQAVRNFTNQIFWQIDPDCILLRDRFHNLTQAEVQALALYAGMSGGVLMTSDALDELSPERLALWKMLLNPRRSACRYPLLGRSPVILAATPDNARPELQLLDPVIVQVRQSEQDARFSAVFIFNTGDTPVQRSYPFSVLGLPEQQYVHAWLAGAPEETPFNQLQCQLPAHAGRLFFTQSTPFTRQPTCLP